jgi:hypothetical protein
VVFFRLAEYGRFSEALSQIAEARSKIFALSPASAGGSINVG